MIAIVSHHKHTALRYGDLPGHVSRFVGRLRRIGLFQCLTVHIHQALLRIQFHRVALTGNDALHKRFAQIGVTIQYHHIPFLRGVQGALNQQPIPPVQGGHHGIAADRHNANHKSKHDHQYN